MSEIVSIVVFSSCLQTLMPITKSKAIRNALSLLIGLAVLHTVCAPLGELTQGAQDLTERIAGYLAPIEEGIKDTETDSEKWVIRYGVKNIERGIQQMIASRFDLKSGELYVEIQTGMAGDGAITVEGILVHMMTDTLRDAGAIEQYVSDMLACPCRVIWEVDHSE